MTLRTRWTEHPTSTTSVSAVTLTGDGDDHDAYEITCDRCGDLWTVDEYSTAVTEATSHTCPPSSSPPSHSYRIQERVAGRRWTTLPVVYPTAAEASTAAHRLTTAVTHRPGPRADGHQVRVVTLTGHPVDERSER